MSLLTSLRIKGTKPPICKILHKSKTVIVVEWAKPRGRYLYSMEWIVVLMYKSHSMVSPKVGLNKTLHFHLAYSREHRVVFFLIDGLVTVANLRKYFSFQVKTITAVNNEL